jgi:hypothetical protein
VERNDLRSEVHETDSPVMTAQDILIFAREWANEHGFPTRNCYPIIRRGSVVLFYVRDHGFVQP